eukprot:scaffold395_cov243-Pinguiococcus_pyrenoidosus.AAC.29
MRSTDASAMVAAALVHPQHRVQDRKRQSGKGRHGSILSSTETKHDKNTKHETRNTKHETRNTKHETRNTKQNSQNTKHKAKEGWYTCAEHRNAGTPSTIALEQHSPESSSIWLLDVDGGTFSPIARIRGRSHRRAAG